MCGNGKRVATSTLFAAATVGLAAGLLMPDDATTSWARGFTTGSANSEGAPSRNEDVAQHLDVVAENDQPSSPDDVLIVKKQEATEPGDVVHHTYGFGQEAYEQRYVTRNYLLITAKTDEVTIKKVVGNRGNCNIGLDVGSAILKGLLSQNRKGDERGQGDGAANAEDEPIATLKFGETKKLQIYCANLIEAEIETDKGSMTFNWNN